jgi:anti-repressor protein
MEMMIGNFEGKQVRTVLLDGNPWWVAKDVCDFFGDTDHKRSVSRVDDDDKDYASITDAIGRPQHATVVNESGLYSLLFAFQPEKATKDGGAHIAPRTEERIKALKRFRKWITSEVLPSIRRTGSYNSIPKTLPEALRLAAEIEEKRQELENQVYQLMPRAAAADRISNAVGLKSLSEIGKINGCGPRRIFDKLADQGILFRRGESWVPYQAYIDQGYFLVRESTYEMNGVDHLYSKTYVTGKGEVWLANKLEGVA